MAALNTAKAVEVLFENALETYDHQMQMLDMVDVFRPDPATFQNSSNIIWRPVQQHAPVKTGWTLDGVVNDPNNPDGSTFGDVIEEYYPATLQPPRNDAFTLRADDLRDMAFWERRGEQSGKKQATFLNQNLAKLVVDTGTLFERVNAVSGYDFLGSAQTILNERQVSSDMRTFVLNERDRQRYAADLAQRGTLSGRPEDSYKTGMIGEQVAQFDVYSGSYLPTLAGGASPTVTITTAPDPFVPVGTTGNAAAGTLQNVDYRTAKFTVDTAADLVEGDRITITNTGNAPINAVGLADKTDTGVAMTFTIVGIVGNEIEVFPKPIAVENPSTDPTNPSYLTPEQRAPANVDTFIKDGAAVGRLNIDVSARTNIFWAKDSIEIIGGDAPIELLSEFGGQKVISSTLKSGLNMYMAYDGNIVDLTFKCRLFTWWGLVNKNPMANGVLVSV